MKTFPRSQTNLTCCRNCTHYKISTDSNNDEMVCTNGVEGVDHDSVENSCRLFRKMEFKSHTGQRNAERGAVDSARGSMDSARGAMDSARGAMDSQTDRFALLTRSEMEQEEAIRFPYSARSDLECTETDEVESSLEWTETNELKWTETNKPLEAPKEMTQQEGRAYFDSIMSEIKKDIQKRKSEQSEI